MILQIIFLFANCMMAVPDNFASHHYEFIPCDSTKSLPNTMVLPQQHHTNQPPTVPPPSVAPPKITPYVSQSPTKTYAPSYTYVENNPSSDNTFNWNFFGLVLVGILFGLIFTVLCVRRIRPNRRISLRNYDEVVTNTRISGNIRTNTDSVTKTENVQWGKDLFSNIKKNYPRDWAILRDFVVEQDDDRKEIIKRDEKIRQQAKEPLYKITDDKTCPVCNTRFNNVGACAKHVRDTHESYGV